MDQSTRQHQHKETTHHTTENPRRKRSHKPRKYVLEANYHQRPQAICYPVLAQVVAQASRHTRVAAPCQPVREACSGKGVSPVFNSRCKKERRIGCQKTTLHDATLPEQPGVRISVHSRGQEQARHFSRASELEVLLLLPKTHRLFHSNRHLLLQHLQILVRRQVESVETSPGSAFALDSQTRRRRAEGKW